MKEKKNNTKSSENNQFGNQRRSFLKTAAMMGAAFTASPLLSKASGVQGEVVLPGTDQAVIQMQ